MDALGLKDNANNVYKNNVNNEALLKELGPLARREKRDRSRSKESISVTGPLTFQLSNMVMYIACAT